MKVILYLLLKVQLFKGNIPTFYLYAYTIVKNLLIGYSVL